MKSWGKFACWFNFLKNREILGKLLGKYNVFLAARPRSQWNALFSWPFGRTVKKNHYFLCGSAK
jgi:hypothetical protein